MQTSCSKEQFIYAGFFSRWMAFLIDSVFLAIVLSFVKVPLWFVKVSASDLFLFKPFLFQFTVVEVFYYLLTLAYFVVMTYYSGATVGKHLMKLKVVDSEGEKLTFMSVLIRESVGKYLSTFIAYVGYIMAGFDTRKQGLHDKIADTCVVYKHGLTQPGMQMPVMQPMAVGQQGQSMQSGQSMANGQAPMGQSMQPQQPMQSGQLVQPGPNGRFSLPESTVQNGRFSQQISVEQPRQPMAFEQSEVVGTDVKEQSETVATDSNAQSEQKDSL